ncbi:hypothetical protein CDAR_474691 [Caerostris darwini]|uniref:Uncharacterized protein n=1 Tax=Caerostris darwini TaxID=1538125 RepID=A0AAV4UYP9_9ARAC|nr:hypothetical protein CDAR_226611 [Caerostris darwini]GIY62825.1 hypothetical protein CDAR_474691 [Caerostris darwini]
MAKHKMFSHNSLLVRKASGYTFCPFLLRFLPRDWIHPLVNGTFCRIDILLKWVVTLSENSLQRNASTYVTIGPALLTIANFTKRAEIQTLPLLLPPQWVRRTKSRHQLSLLFQVVPHKLLSAASL